MFLLKWSTVSLALGLDREKQLAHVYTLDLSGMEAQCCLQKKNETWKLALVFIYFSFEIQVNLVRMSK